MRNIFEDDICYDENKTGQYVTECHRTSTLFFLVLNLYLNK